jgi:hypothetical protein
MNKKSATALLGVAIFVGGDYALEYSDAHKPRTHVIAETYALDYDYSLGPRIHVHREMHTEAVATTASYLAASGAQHFELKHFTWRIKQVSPYKYDTFRDGQFMGTRTKKQLWMDANFHSRYESLISELDRTHEATFQIVKGALSQFNPFPA